MSYDLPNTRGPETSMRDLLRRLERGTITPPMRPRPWPEPGAAAISGPRIGAWTLAEDPDTGDLIATHDDGAIRLLATKGTD